MNAPALAVGLAALDDDDYARRTLAVVPQLREGLRSGLSGLGLTVFGGQANYLLCRTRTL